MKQAENGVKIFYSVKKANVGIALGILLGTALVFLLGIYLLPLPLKMIILLLVILAAGLGAVVFLWKQHMPPVCIVYPDKIYARKQEMLWRDAQFYAVEGTGTGAVFTLAGISHGQEYRVAFSLQHLSEADRELLLQEVTARRVPTEQRYFERIQLELMGLSQGFKRVGRRMK